MQYRLNLLLAAALTACAACVATAASAASDGPKSDPASNSGPDKADPAKEAGAKPAPGAEGPAATPADTPAAEEVPSSTQAPSETTGPSPTTAPSEAPQPPSETTAILASLPQDEATQKVVEDAVGKARKALARATDMRNADDPEHARMMDAVAVEWARVAVDLVKAREAETLLTKIQRELFDLKQKIDRARLLLEETHARKARAGQQLDDLTQSESSPKKGTAK